MEKKKKKKKKNLFLRVMSYMGMFKITYIFSLIISAVSGVISFGAYVYVYYAARELIAVKGNNQLLNVDLIKSYGWKAVLYVSISFGFYGMALALSHIAAFNTVAKVRIKLVRHLSTLPLGFYNTHPSGKMRKMIEKNTHELENFIAHQSPDAVQAFITPLAFLVCIFIFDWKLALICLIPIIIGFILLKSMLGGESEKFLEIYQSSAENMGNDVVEYIRGISVVKVFGQSVFSFKSFNQSIQKYRNYMLKYALSMKKAMSGYITCIYGIFGVLIPAAIIFFNYSSNPQQLILSYIFFVIFTPMVAVMLMRVMESSYKSMIAANALDSIENDILDMNTLHQSSNSKTISNFGIEFDSVDFRYEKDAEKAIDNLTFKAKEGTITALVGPSGGGKTSVLNLIARFWDVENGRILIGGVDVKEINYQTLMDNISFVFQETNLFKMSIADNVTFYNPNATKEDIYRVLHMAQCDDIIAKLPKGIDTVIGTKGIYLSGGEMQRIAIARALLKNSPIILLDEATAFADPENEYKIQKALNVLMKGKTVFMIAHRLSTIVNANQILVMKDGALAERGTHIELMQKNGIYTKMYNEYQKSTSWKIGGNDNVEKNLLFI